MDFFWDLPGWVKPRSACLQGSFLGALPALSSHDLSYLIHGELPKDRPSSTLPPAPSTQQSAQLSNSSTSVWKKTWSVALPRNENSEYKERKEKKTRDSLRVQLKKSEFWHCSVTHGREERHKNMCPCLWLMNAGTLTACDSGIPKNIKPWKRASVLLRKNFK